MTFVHLTNPTGHVVAIKADQVVDLREALDAEAKMMPGARTMILLSNGTTQAVKEPMDVVEAKLG